MQHRITLFLTYDGNMKKKKKESLWQRIKKIEFRTSYVVVAVILAVVLRYWGENTITMLQKEVPVITNTEPSGLIRIVRSSVSLMHFSNISGSLLPSGKDSRTSVIASCIVNGFPFVMTPP